MTAEEARKSGIREAVAVAKDYQGYCQMMTGRLREVHPDRRAYEVGAQAAREIVDRIEGLLSKEFDPIPERTA